jgi:hypothetical protein
VFDPTFYGWAPATTSSLTTAILESWLLNHSLRETHSFRQLGETKIGGASESSAQVMDSPHG